MGELRTTLNRQIGAFKVWQWLLIAIAGVALGLIIRRRFGIKPGDTTGVTETFDGTSTVGMGLEATQGSPPQPVGTIGGTPDQGDPQKPGEGSGQTVDLGFLAQIPGITIEQVPGGATVIKFYGQEVTLEQIQQMLADQNISVFDFDRFADELLNRDQGQNAALEAPVVQTVSTVITPVEAPIIEPDPIIVAPIPAGTVAMEDVATGTQYTVVSGDTLTKLGQRFGMPWQDIYNANVDVIGDDPNIILPGQVLRIPS